MSRSGALAWGRGGTRAGPGWARVSCSSTGTGCLQGRVGIPATLRMLGGEGSRLLFPAEMIWCSRMFFLAFFWFWLANVLSQPAVDLTSPGWKV